MLLWAVMCWGTLGFYIYVDVTLTHLHKKTVADQIHSFMETVFLKASGLFHQDILPHCIN